MATIHESLKSINGYPVPESTFIEIATSRDLELTEDATKTVLKSNSYRLAKADVMMWLSYAPDVKQADVSYSFNEDERKALRKAANAIYGELGDDAFTGTRFGYKGNRL
jgi:hypothetical protein